MNNLPLTDLEIIEIAKSHNPSAIWKKAFDFYNSDPRNQKLSMACRPCFFKVMTYILNIRFIQEDSIKLSNG